MSTQPERPWEQDKAAEEAARKKARPTYWPAWAPWAVLGALVFLVVIFTAGGNQDNGGGGGSGASGSVSKYQQTWSQDYSSTTCSQWVSAMNPHQRFAAAADMLVGARNNGDGGSGLPPDNLIYSFQGDIDQACSVGATADSQSLAETAASVYLVGRSTYRP